MLKRVSRGFLAFAILAAMSAAASAAERFALVIGNSKYESVSALDNPTRDAEAITELLSTAGFEVSLGLDLGQSNMRRAISAFAAKMSDKGEDTTALVYFAGHGIQVDGQNYVLPIDAQLKTESDVALEAVRLADVMSVLNTIPSKTRIVILDACRNNPFGDAAKGLAIVNAPAGTLVAYSTSPGAVAEDGVGSNSPFTAALVKAAQKPGAAVESVFQNVRLAVHKATEGRQTPWEVTALTTPFQFFPGEAGAEIKPVPEKSNTVWRKELRSVSPEKAYEKVVVQNNVTVYQIFLSLYPQTEWSLRIRGIMERRVEMLAWFDALRLNSVAAFEEFLRRYPKSDLTPTANRLLKRAELQSAGARDWDGVLGVTTTPPKVRTVTKEVIKRVRVPVTKEVIKKVRVPVVKEVIKEVRVPVVKIKTVVKEVPVIKYKDKIVYKDRVVYKDRIVYKDRVVYKDRIVYKTKTVKVPGPTKIKTVVKRVPGPTKIKTVVKRVPGPTRIKTVVKTVRAPCRCSTGGARRLR